MSEPVPGAGMVYLPDDHEHYAKVFQTFTRCSGKLASGKVGEESWISSAFNDTLIQRLRDFPQKPQPLRVLSVGSGEGNIDCAILQQVLPSFPQICNTVVEPSASQLDLYRKLVAQRADDVKGISFDWRQLTSDEYLDESAADTEQGPRKFHLITAIHVLYYVADVKDTIKRLYDLLEDGGLLYIVVQDESSVANLLSVLINEYQGSNSRPILLTDKEVRTALDSLSITYATERVPLHTRTNTIFEDETSEQGNQLLDFITHTKDFRKSAPSGLKESILKFLRTPRVAEEEDGQIYLLRYYTLFFISK